MTVTTQFKVGSEVWIMHNNKPMKTVIFNYTIEVTKKEILIYAIIGDSTMPGDLKVLENRLFDSKENLLATL